MDLSKRILVVEDNQIQLVVCTTQLKELGFEKLSVAKNGVRAYSILEKGSVDLVLSDLEMPEMGGLELLKKVKENPSLQNIPFIILSAREDEKIYNEIKSLGADDFIVKPGSPEIFKEKLGKLI